jgi:hypothetical protein
LTQHHGPETWFGGGLQNLAGISEVRPVLISWPVKQSLGLALRQLFAGGVLSPSPRSMITTSSGRGRALLPQTTRSSRRVRFTIPDDDAKLKGVALRCHTRWGDDASRSRVQSPRDRAPEGAVRRGSPPRARPPIEQQRDGLPKRSLPPRVPSRSWDAGTQARHVA